MHHTKKPFKNKLLSFMPVILLSGGMLFMTSPALAYYVNQGKIYTNSGEVVPINGVNWSGFQDSGFVDELYGNVPLYKLDKKNMHLGVMDMLTQPWQFSADTGVSNENSVGFKSIRLPIAPKTVVDDTLNSNFRYDLTDPANHQQGNGVFCATWGGDSCAVGITKKESLYTLIKEFQSNNVRVLLDIHQTDQGRNGNVEPLSSDNNYLQTLLQNVKTRNLDNVLGIDVFNEPHNLNWMQASGSQPSWVSYIASVAAVTYDNNPDLLLFVEGTSGPGDVSNPVCMTKVPSAAAPCQPNDSNWACIKPEIKCPSGQQALAIMANWGEDYKALLTKNNLGVADGDHPTFDVKSFRLALVNALVNEVHVTSQKATAIADWLLGADGQSNAKAHLVFSPHVYGRHVTTWQNEPSPAEAHYRFDSNWGFLVDSGYPVVIGESGYDPSFQTDVDFFEKSLMPYMLSKKMGGNLFYWTFNTNSGDTKGVRADANTAALVVQKEKDLHDLYETTTDLK